MTSIIRYIFALELVFGAQARLTHRLTPTVRQKALAKAEGYKHYLPFIPGDTPEVHSRNIGYLMGLAGLGLLLPSGVIQMGAAALGTALAVMGVYAQRSMGIPCWLPCVNTILGLSIVVSRA